MSTAEPDRDRCADVHRHVLDHVSPDELRTLATVFARLTESPPGLGSPA